MAAPPFKVKSVYEYTSEHGDDLTFPIGQVITVTELEGDDWYVGEYTDAAGSKQEGLFPTNFVERYEPEVPTRPSRPARAKQEPAQPAPPSEPAAEEAEEEEGAPPLPAASKPAPPPVEVPPTVSAPAEEVTSPPSATSQKGLPIRQEPPPAPKAVPVEPAEPEAAPTPAKKAPPPIAAKSNAFKDRIAAFNQPAAAPIAPMGPGRKPEPNFIKKPFVAPPPSKNAYIPPVNKQEPIHKPYHRDEDPEIKQREEEDRAAAEAAGLGGDQPAAPAGQAEEGEEDAPKPLTLKERMALLQKQQQEQAQRRAESGTLKKEKKAPVKRPSESSEQILSPEDEGEGLERSRSTREKQSMDIPRDVPPMPSSSRRPTEPMSPTAQEASSDGHEADQSGAGELTEDDSGTLGPDKDESDEKATEALRHPRAPKAEPDMGDQQNTAEDDEDEEEEEMDEETRRKEELRARMARLGGGGLPGMGGPFNPFGAPPPAPPRKKASKDRKASEDTPVSPPQSQRAPMVPVPGMAAQQRMQSPESDTTQRVQRDLDETPQEEIEEPEFPTIPKRQSTIDRAAPPPVPSDSRPLPPPPSQERPVPPPPGSGVTPRPPAPESRAVPPPPPTAAPMSPGPGSESDDEASMHAKRSSAETSGIDTPLTSRPTAPPVPGSRDVSREIPPRPPQSPENKRTSYFNNEPPSATADKRASRPPPPVPSDSPVTSPRPPPPPPPTQAPISRQNTMDERDDDERIGSDYDGDYDTDIASSAKHKDALKASPHVREPSLTDNIPTGEETPVNSPPQPPSQTSAPRAVPPPPPQAPPRSRPSMDRPPPPVPAAQDAAADDDYDPYRYPTQQQRAVPPPPNSAPRAVPPVPPVQEPETLQEESSADELYAPPSPPRKSMDRAPPQPPPQAPPAQAPPRTSLDAPRAAAVGRRSMDQSRPSGEHSGQIANDIPLHTSGSSWWTAEQPLPPSLQPRNGIDILSECEESSKSKRGGRKEVSKDIYILYLDYSQTVIAARYDSQDPAEVHLEQRHEPPPPRMRQDQLEAAWQRFGAKIADAAAQVGNSKKSAPLGDETPAGLPLALIKAQPNALLPVGTRAYGALVYANLANASTMQYDEIRRGDILTLRNAKFEGHHGAMKTKYRADYGASHVVVVEEWDGTRRSVRGWEQGREKKGGVRSEKLRLGDLRSGECRVWRVVGREWVGWDS